MIDQVRCRSARSFIDALRTLGAHTVDRAVCIDAIKGEFPHAPSALRFLLGGGSALGAAISRTADNDGTDLWYLTADESTESTDRVQKNPYVLRENGVVRTSSLILGIILTFAASEAVIHFLPQITSVLSSFFDLIG